jgi:hypothetical protein
MKRPTKEMLEVDVMSDLTWPEIAAKYGYTDSRFLRTLAKRYELPPRRKLITPSKETLYQLICVEGLTPYEVADKLGYGKGGWSNVYAYCREYGIEFDFTVNADLRNTSFTPDQRSIVVGTLLGDGYLRPHGKIEKNYSLCFAHGEKQIEYLEWMKDNLKPFTTSDIPYKHKKTSLHNHATVHSYHTVCHPWLTELRKAFYPDGKKTVSIDWLNQVDELALAVWYMDDGSLNKRYGTMTFCTNGFSYEEHLLIQQWFLDRWKLPVVIENRRNNQYSIRVNASVAKHLREILRPYIPPCMSYKVDFK